jgi:hypothetical protein
MFNCLDYSTVRLSLLGDRPSHSTVYEEMDTITKPCLKFVKLQYNSTTQSVICTPVLRTAVKKILDKAAIYGEARDKPVLDIFARADIQVCHKRARTLGSNFTSS